MEPEAPPARLPQPPLLYDHREAPGEDVWAKFELLASSPGSALPAGPGAAAADEGGDCLLEPCGLLGNLSAFVLRDCMWSGFSARLERARGDKAGAKAPGPQQAAAAAATTPSGAQEPGLAGGQCVAPGAVFAWPAGGGGGGGGGGGAPSDSKIRASSGSESPSDSEGEEIDVVTVDKRHASLAARKPVTITVRADPLDPGTTHFHIAIHRQQHNYAARSPSEGFSGPGPLERAPQRRLQQEEEEEEEEEEEGEASDGGPWSPGRGAEGLPSKAFLPKAGSAPSSDSEDATKRRNHNDLERKRRKDLRSRFLALRDQLPGLAACAKTPKVAVLSQASQFLRSLLQAEQRMVAEKARLQSRRLRLLTRIARLQGSGPGLSASPPLGGPGSSAADL